MINRTAIQQWSEHAPWIDNTQIEQDLIICRALVSIFNDECLASQLAFFHLSHVIVRTLIWFRLLLDLSNLSCID